MVTLKPIPLGLVPVDSDAAQALCSPNYDEFQGNREIFDLIRRQPRSILRITMPHAGFRDAANLPPEGSQEALEAAAARMAELRRGQLTRHCRDFLFLYEIVDPARPGVRQIGLGGLLAASEIVTDQAPGGTVVRNEGIHPAKARGRADLIRATHSMIGIVNHAVEDGGDQYARALETCADRGEPDFTATSDGCQHRVWLLPPSGSRDRVARALGAEPCTYVADGNHRSAAAAMLGLDFLSVVFPASRMGLAPYNRLARTDGPARGGWREALSTAFRVGSVPGPGNYQPSRPHSIGFYSGGEWLRLAPRAATYDAADAAASIDADIVQRQIFSRLCGIPDPRDGRLTFVGGDRDAAYLRQRVDSGEFTLAVTLSPVTMGQFIRVCRQRRMMPPKSTWFSPKIRSGLVMAILE